MGQRMGGLQRGDDPLQLRAELEGVQRLLVRRVHIFHAAELMQPGMLGADAGVIQARADGVAFQDLAELILQQIGAVAMQHARAAPGEARRVLRRVHAMAAGFHAEHPHRGVIQEGVEQPHGVGATADGGHQHIRQAALGLLHLRAGFLADHRLEVAHHHRIGVRAGHGADAVVGVLDIRDPVAQRLVHRILQRGGAGGDGDDLGAQQLHAEDVGLLPLDIGGAHEDGAGQVEQRAGGGRGHAMLAGAGLGDDALLAHALGEQDLPQHGVDLVRAGVVQLIALEIDLRTLPRLGLGAAMLGDALGGPERARAAHIILQQAAPFGIEGGIGLGPGIGGLDLEDQRHQRLGDVAAAKAAKAPGGIRAALVGVGLEELVQLGIPAV